MGAAFGVEHAAGMAKSRAPAVSTTVRTQASACQKLSAANGLRSTFMQGTALVEKPRHESTHFDACCTTCRTCLLGRKLLLQTLFPQPFQLLEPLALLQELTSFCHPVAQPL